MMILVPIQKALAPDHFSRGSCPNYLSQFLTESKGKD